MVQQWLHAIRAFKNFLIGFTTTALPNTPVARPRRPFCRGLATRFFIKNLNLNGRTKEARLKESQASSVYWITVILLVPMTVDCSLITAKHRGIQSPLEEPFVVLDPVLHQAALDWTDQHCNTCHGGSASMGGYGDSDDVASMVLKGMIVPGDADASEFFQRANQTSQPMPTSGRRPDDEVSLIRDWINTGIARGSPPDEGDGPPQGPEGLDTLSKLGMYLVSDQDLFKQASDLIVQKCLGCHDAAGGDNLGGGFSTAADLDSMVKDRMIKPGNASTSNFYLRSSDGSMPPGGGLNSNEEKLIQDWINLALSVGPNTPQEIPLAATFSSIYVNILVPKCITCHGPVRADNGVRYDNYALTLDKGEVSPGNGLNSAMWEEVNDDKMPEPPVGLLNDNEKQAILDWIDDGALDN